MKIEIVGKNNYKPADRLKEIIEKKVERLSRYFEETDGAKAKVVLNESGGREKFAMEVTFTFEGANFIRSEVRSENMYDNIDTVLPKLERQIRRYKTKINKKKVGTPIAQAIYEETEAKAEPELVRTKTLDLETISLEDAVMGLDMVGHGFYLFVNSETGKVAGVYIRHDGNIGHLELNY